MEVRAIEFSERRDSVTHLRQPLARCHLGGIFARWDAEAFNVTTMFASDENVAVFGDFRYKSKSLGQVVSSPFAILVKVVDGKVTYLQFLEDTYATAASFRKDGAWTVQTEPDSVPFQV
jgi:ketosteroid isomerase-like protein